MAIFLKELLMIFDQFYLEPSIYIVKRNRAIPYFCPGHVLESVPTILCTAATTHARVGYLM